MQVLSPRSEGQADQPAAKVSQTIRVRVTGPRRQPAADASLGAPAGDRGQQALNTLAAEPIDTPAGLKRLTRLFRHRC
jgi:hypothetical protein